MHVHFRQNVGLSDRKTEEINPFLTSCSPLFLLLQSFGTSRFYNTLVETFKLVWSYALNILYYSIELSLCHCSSVCFEILNQFSRRLCLLTLYKLKNTCLLIPSPKGNVEGLWRVLGSRVSVFSLCHFGVHTNVFSWWGPLLRKMRAKEIFHMSNYSIFKKHSWGLLTTYAFELSFPCSYFFFCGKSCVFLRDILPKKFNQCSVSCWALLIGKFQYQLQERFWFHCVLNFLFHLGGESF